jgi:hypothetical protein
MMSEPVGKFATVFARLTVAAASAPTASGSPSSSAGSSAMTRVGPRSA